MALTQNSCQYGYFDSITATNTGHTSINTVFHKDFSVSWNIS